MTGPILVMYLKFDISMKQAWGDLQCTHISCFLLLLRSTVKFFLSSTEAELSAGCEFLRIILVCSCARENR